MDNITLWDHKTGRHLLNSLAVRTHTNSKDKGFYDLLLRSLDLDENTKKELQYLESATKIALIHSEASEILEALRKENYELEAEEVADVIIRALDYAAWRGIDIDKEIAAKMQKNANRPYKHGKKF